MIDIMYMVGDSVWREPAKQLFTMNVLQKDEEGNDMKLNVIAAVKEDGMVNVFYKEGESMEDANSTIVNSVNECDLRAHKLFAVHTLDEFMAMRSVTANGKTVPMKKDGDGNLVQPMPTPKELPKEDETEEAESTEEATEETEDTENKEEESKEEA